MIPQTGMPDPSQMPQQVMLPPQEVHRPSDIVIDVLGLRVPSEALHTFSFWVLIFILAAVVLGVAYFKYGKKSR